MSIAELIVVYRRRCGWSQYRLAEALCEASGRTTVSRDEVARWERGKRRPSRYWLTWLAAVFDVDLVELERVAYGTGSAPTPSADSALRVAQEWLVTDPPQVTHLRAGRRVGASLAAESEVRVHELRLLDDHLGGNDTAELVGRELVDTRQVVDTASYTEATGRRLLSALAELGQLAGWVASDAGEHAMAQQYYLDAVRAGHAAADPVTAANALSSLAYQTANVGDPSGAVLLARSAVKGAAGRTSGRSRALLLERVAWAHARAGESAQAEQALDAVDDAYAQASDDEPAWVYWLDRREIDVMAGRCYVELRRPLRAVPLLTEAIAGYNHTHAREVGLYETWLAEAYQQANERDAAAAALGRAAHLAEMVNSERLATRVAALSR